MVKKGALLLISLILIGIVFYSGLGSRITRKINTFIAEHKPHNAYVPTPALGTQKQVTLNLSPTPKLSTTQTPTPTMPPIPAAYKLSNIQHTYQTWNNCGPATTAMTLSFYQSPFTQKEIAPYLKPDSEDKNVSPDEIVQFISKKTDLQAAYGINGNQELLKRLIAHNTPVMIESWFNYRPNDEMGHYELVVGYDDNAKTFTLYDSFRGPNISVSYLDQDNYWKVFDRTFIVIAPKKTDPYLDTLLQPYKNKDEMLQGSLHMAQMEIQKDQNDKFAYYNLGTTLQKMGKNKEAVVAFDKARTLNLPWRMLWYQFSIFDAYLAEGRYEDVILLASTNLSQTNNLEESYYYRGMAYAKTGKNELARADFQKALKYNPQFIKASEALKQLP